MIKTPKKALVVSLATTMLSFVPAVAQAENDEERLPSVELNFKALQYLEETYIPAPDFETFTGSQENKVEEQAVTGLPWVLPKEESEIEQEPLPPTLSNKRENAPQEIFTPEEAEPTESEVLSESSVPLVITEPLSDQEEESLKEGLKKKRTIFSVFDALPFFSDDEEEEEKTPELSITAKEENVEDEQPEIDTVTIENETEAEEEIIEAPAIVETEEESIVVEVPKLDVKQEESLVSQRRPLPTIPSIFSDDNEFEVVEPVDVIPAPKQPEIEVKAPEPQVAEEVEPEEAPTVEISRSVQPLPKPKPVIEETKQSLEDLADSIKPVEIFSTQKEADKKQLEAEKEASALVLKDKKIPTPEPKIEEPVEKLEEKASEKPVTEASQQPIDIGVDLPAQLSAVEEPVASLEEVSEDKKAVSDEEAEEQATAPTALATLEEAESVDTVVKKQDGTLIEQEEADEAPSLLDKTLDSTKTAISSIGTSLSSMWGNVSNKLDKFIEEKNETVSLDSTTEKEVQEGSLQEPEQVTKILAEEIVDEGEKISVPKIDDMPESLPVATNNVLEVAEEELDTIPVEPVAEEEVEVLDVDEVIVDDEKEQKVDEVVELHSLRSPLLLTQLSFTPDDAKISPEQEKKIKEAIAPYLKKNTTRFKIISYAYDENQQASASRRVSLQRSIAVRTRMVSYGIKGSYINVQALGEHPQGGELSNSIFIYRIQD